MNYKKKLFFENKFREQIFLSNNAEKIVKQIFGYLLRKMLFCDINYNRLNIINGGANGNYKTVRKMGWW